MNQIPVRLHDHGKTRLFDHLHVDIMRTANAGRMYVGRTRDAKRARVDIDEDKRAMVFHVEIEIENERS